MFSVQFELVRILRAGAESRKEIPSSAHFRALSSNERPLRLAGKAGRPPTQWNRLYEGLPSRFVCFVYVGQQMDKKGPNFYEMSKMNSKNNVSYGFI